MRAPRILLVGVSVIAVLAATYGFAVASTGHSQVARAIVWLEADVDDWQRFPARTIAAGEQRVDLLTEPSSAAADAFGSVADARQLSHADLDDFLTATQTTALLVIDDGTVITEWYGTGSSREATQTSFSMAKSVVSTLVGIAIAEGAFGSVDDPITDYVPELLERDARFADITLEHLMTMSSGIAYVELGTPWSDDAATYYSPNLRETAVRIRMESEPGETWLYNNYNPLLLGLALERATGETVAAFAERTLWSRLGAEADASWSLDSERSGFEKMESGINARAIDFAKFAVMIADGGRGVDGQIVDAGWIADATALSTEKDPAEHYGRFWWVYPNTGLVSDYSARGNHGQFLYVIPDEDIIIVRFGRAYGYDDWPGLFADWGREIASVRAATEP